jgi:ABC-type cobalamin/Fe3+-siderophores transport system ATPase subunit
MKDGQIIYDAVPTEVLTVKNIQQIFGINSMIISEPGSGNSIISFSL